MVPLLYNPYIRFPTHMYIMKCILFHGMRVLLTIHRIAVSNVIKFSPWVTVCEPFGNLNILRVKVMTNLHHRCQMTHGILLTSPTRTRWQSTVLRPRDTLDKVLRFARQLMNGVDGKMRSEGLDPSKGFPEVYMPLSYFFVVHLHMFFGGESCSARRWPLCCSYQFCSAPFRDLLHRVRDLLQVLSYSTENRRPRLLQGYSLVQTLARNAVGLSCRHLRSHGLYFMLKGPLSHDWNLFDSRLTGRHLLLSSHTVW